MNMNQHLIDKVEKELNKEFTNRNIDKEKQELINKLKSIKKEELFKKQKYTLWQRIKKTLGF
jgi:hypothetical protein